MNGEPFAIWVLYDHPRDLPDYFVVRRHTARQDGGIEPEARAYCFHELATARAWLAQQDLTCLARHPNDDPVILETWL